MSFEQQTVKQLKDAADYFGVDLAAAKGKDAIIAALKDDGVSFQDADKFVFNPDGEGDIVVDVPDRPSKPAAPTGPTLLVRMTRSNPRYDAEANGRLYTFTRSAPFCVMPEEDADVIVEREEGFRIATPREAREFYG